MKVLPTNPLVSTHTYFCSSKALKGVLPRSCSCTASLKKQKNNTKPSAQHLHHRDHRQTYECAVKLSIAAEQRCITAASALNITYKSTASSRLGGTTNKPGSPDCTSHDVHVVNSERKVHRSSLITCWRSGLIQQLVTLR